MNIYFIKSTYTGNTYRLSDFFVGNNYIQNANKMLDINTTFDDGVTSFITDNLTLPDTTSIRDYTHVIVPSLSKIYRIVKVDYLNKQQVEVLLDEDPLIANYQNFKNISMYQNGTIDSTKFIGNHSIKDISIKKETTNIQIKPYTASNTGLWALMTFQGDVQELKLKFRALDKKDFEYFTILQEVRDIYPDIDDNTKRYWEIPYFLKIVNIADILYQFICTGNNGYYWTAIRSFPTVTGTVEFTIDASKFVHRSQLGDIGTVNLLLPLDYSVSTEVASTGTFVSLPNYHNLISWNQADKLIGIKIIPQELLEVVSVSGAIRDNYGTGSYYSKIITWRYPTYISQGATPSITDASFVFQNNFNVYHNISLSIPPSNVLDYEPFKEYYLYLFGSVIKIPARYLTTGTSLFLNIVMTSNELLYEINAGARMNIIASGKIMMNARYSVDQLNLFYSQNPTYKDQFMVQQLTNIATQTASGAIGGSIIPGLGTVTGAIGGLASGLVNTATAGINLAFQESSMRQVADKIFGENDIAMTLAKGMGMFYIVVTPESNALNQMINAYRLTGFQTNLYQSIESITKYTGLWTNYRLVRGYFAITIKNNYVTEFINQKMMEGVIFID